VFALLWIALRVEAAVTGLWGVRVAGQQEVQGAALHCTAVSAGGQRWGAGAEQPPSTTVHVLYIPYVEGRRVDA